MKMAKPGIHTLLALLVGAFTLSAMYGIWLLVMDILEQHDRSMKQLNNEYTEHLNQSFLANMASYIEEQYPILEDMEWLKREAGTDRFWQIADEWRELAGNFGFAYIYYIEKTDEGYVFRMSSGILRDKHSEWLGRPVWAKAHPAFVDEAYATKQRALSPKPIPNEWGELISAVLPIVSDDRVIGLLGVDYDVSSFRDSRMRQESLLARHQEKLKDDISNIFILVGIFIFFVQFFRIRLAGSGAAERKNP